jgi:hypothetical protein
MRDGVGKGLLTLYPGPATASASQLTSPLLRLSSSYLLPHTPVSFGLWACSQCPPSLLAQVWPFLQYLANKSQSLRASKAGGPGHQCLAFSQRGGRQHSQPAEEALIWLQEFLPRALCSQRHWCLPSSPQRGAI